MRRHCLAVFLLGMVLSVPVLAEEKQKTPEEAWDGFKKAAVAGDGKAMWGFFSNSTRKKLVDGEQGKAMDAMRQGTEEQVAEMAKHLGVTVEELKKLTVEEMYIHLLATELAADKEKIEKTEFKVEKIEENKALCNTKDGEGKKEKVVLVKEDGTWRMDMEATDELKKADEGGDEGEGDEGEGDEGDEGGKDEGSGK